MWGTLVLALALVALAANAYVGFEVWLGSLAEYLDVPGWLARNYRPVNLGWQHVLLAFGAPLLVGIGGALLILFQHNAWRLALVVAIISLPIGCNGALGRFRQLKHQRSNVLGDGSRRD